MFTFRRSRPRSRAACVAVAVSTCLMTLSLGLAPAHAITITFIDNFNDNSAAPAILNGSAVINNGGSNGTPNVLLTPNTASQTGSLILPDLSPGVAVQSFMAGFDLQIGPGTSTPADGTSFVFGQLTDNSLFGEEGPPAFNGLTLSFDIFDNGGGEAPAIEVLLNNVLVPGGRSTTNPFTNGAFVPVFANFDPDGTFDLIFNNSPIFTNLATGFVPEAGDRFGFGARTGGFSAEQRIDNVNISAVTAVPEPGTMTLMGLGLAGLIGAGRRKRKGKAEEATKA